MQLLLIGSLFFRNKPFSFTISSLEFFVKKLPNYSHFGNTLFPPWEHNIPSLGPLHRSAFWTLCGSEARGDARLASHNPQPYRSFPVDVFQIKFVHSLSDLMAAGLVQIKPANRFLWICSRKTLLSSIHSFFLRIASLKAARTSSRVLFFTVLSINVSLKVQYRLQR